MWVGTAILIRHLTWTASAMNCDSLGGMGDVDSRQKTAPRIQCIVPLAIGPLRTNPMH